MTKKKQTETTPPSNDLISQAIAEGQRHPQIADVLLSPMQGILVSADDPIDQHGRPLARGHALFAIAGIEHAGGI